jgi:hypothetical protein
MITALALATALPKLARADAGIDPVPAPDQLRALLGKDSGPVLLVGLGSAFSATAAVRQALERGGIEVRRAGLADRPAFANHLVDAGLLCRTHGTGVVILVEDLTPEQALAKVIDATGVVRGVVLLGPPGPPPAPEMPAPQAVAQDAYQNGVLGVDPSGPYQGPDRRRLSWEDFYRITGRPDLVDAQEHQRQVRYALGGLGGTALGAGVLWGIADLTVNFIGAAASAPFCLFSSAGRHDSGATPPSNDFCDGPQPSAIPWVVAATGAGMLLAIPLIPRQSTSDQAARALASAHNQQLRQRYGLTVEAAPLVAPDTGGLLLRGQF